MANMNGNRKFNTFNNIVVDITKFNYDRIDFLFQFLGIKNSEWNIKEAYIEFNGLIKEQFTLKRKHTKPSFMVVAGIPCSGKSSYINQLKDDSTDCIRIQFDSIMEKLSYYKQLTRSEGHKIAFEKCELIARVVGYQLLKEALMRRYRIIFEHSSTLIQHIDLYKFILKDLSYDFRMVYVNVSLNTALERNKNGRKNNRYTSSKMIKERYFIIQKLLPTYQKVIPVEIVSGE
jgi:predicted kinase